MRNQVREWGNRVHAALAQMSIPKEFLLDEGSNVAWYVVMQALLGAAGHELTKVDYGMVKPVAITNGAIGGALGLAQIAIARQNYNRAINLHGNNLEVSWRAQVAMVLGALAMGSIAWASNCAGRGESEANTLLGTSAAAGFLTMMTGLFSRLEALHALSGQALVDCDGLDDDRAQALLQNQVRHDYSDREKGKQLNQFIKLALYVSNEVFIGLLAGCAIRTMNHLPGQAAVVATNTTAAGVSTSAAPVVDRQMLEHVLRMLSLGNGFTGGIVGVAKASLGARDWLAAVNRDGVVYNPKWYQALILALTVLATLIFSARAFLTFGQDNQEQAAIFSGLAGFAMMTFGMAAQWIGADAKTRDLPESQVGGAARYQRFLMMGTAGQTAVRSAFDEEAQRAAAIVQPSAVANV